MKDTRAVSKASNNRSAGYLLVPGKLDEAERDLNEALKLASSSPMIHEHLGDIYDRQGKLKTRERRGRKLLLLNIRRAVDEDSIKDVVRS